MGYKTFMAVGPIRITDKFGSLFYQYNPKTNKTFFFNLNLEVFDYDGQIWESKKKLIYLTGLRNRKVMLPEDISIVFTSDGNKAALYPQSGILTIDERYRNEPFFILAFLYYHEFAHFMYPSPNGQRSTHNEFKCDRFAAAMMLRRGYNPSQILAAMKFALGDGDEQNLRYKWMVKYLNNVKYVLR